MGKRFWCFVFVGLVLAVSLIFGETTQKSGTANAQVTKSTPDLSGIWNKNPGDPVRQTFRAEPAPMQPWAQYRYDYAMNPARPTERGRPELDPEWNCMPPGPTLLMLMPGGSPVEIIQSPERVLLLFEFDHWIRIIWTDGRELPEELEPSWNGYSIGKWEGDTLVVETVGLNEHTWLDRRGTPHSDALRVVERFRRVDRDTLEVEFLFDDPKAFTEPWTAKKIYKLQTDVEIQVRVHCEDELLKKIRF